MINTTLHPWTPKILWLMVPSLAGASVWWYIVARTLQGHIAFSTAALPTLATFVIFGVFGLSLWFGSFNLLAYLVTWRSARWLLSLVTTLPLLAFFPLKLLTLIGVAGLWLVIWWGMERVAGDAHNRLAVKPQLTFGSALSVIVVAVMLVVSLLYYQQLRGTEKTSKELASRLSDQTVTLVERFLSATYTEYRSDMPVDEVIGLQIPSSAELLQDIKFDTLDQSELQNALRESLSRIEGFDPESLRVEPSTTRADLERDLDVKLVDARRQLSEEVRKNLSDQFSVPILGEDKVHDVLVRIVNRQFERYIKNYVIIIPWLLALALFLILRVFSGVFLFATTWIGWAFYRLYRSLHILDIEHVTVPAESLTWHP